MQNQGKAYRPSQIGGPTTSSVTKAEFWFFFLLFMEQHLCNSYFTYVLKLISKCLESTLKMKSCVSPKYYHYTIIIKHIKVTESCKLNRWRMTVLPSIWKEDDKWTTSTERGAMDISAKQVSLREWEEEGLPLLLGWMF